MDNIQAYEVWDSGSIPLGGTKFLKGCHMTKNVSRISEIDTDKCVELAGANRYNLVLMASVRSREISRRNKESMQFAHLHPNVTAILEIQEGKIGTEYLKKVK